MRFKEHLKGVISLALTVLMIFAVVLSVSAAEEDLAATGAGETVYFRNTDNWSPVKAYIWSDTNGDYRPWSGEEMTLFKDNVYKYTIPGDYDKIIFTNGNGAQTADLSVQGDGYIFDRSTGQWSVYPEHNANNPTPTSSTPTPTTPTPTNPPAASGNYVYCKNDAGWNTVNVYMWKDGLGDNGGWPGVKMTNIGDNIWQYEVTADYNMVIFNNGSTQTSDLSYPGAGHIYNNSTGKWEKYDTSPIVVKSYGTDAESPQYSGVEISLTASATSTGGMVYYKFSVKNPAGTTTVLKDFSTSNVALWTPTAIGTYTLVYDFKDASGNTNQRTATYVIEDDKAVVSPIIKKVSPAPGQVKYNTNMTISVTASGGNTGTKLLFYKYTVKNANGTIVNVPYYTKSATYTYKPTTQGKFTVTVSLQNSDNDIVERVYTYDSVVNITPTTPAQTVPVTTPGGSSNVRGDADGDGTLSVMDATQIQRFVAQLITQDDLRYDLADYEGDGVVSVMDATAIQQTLAGLN